MLIIRKIWSWLKAYWFVPLIIVGIIIAIAISPKSAKSLVNMITKRREVHGKEVAILEQAREDEIRERESALSRFHLSMEMIEEKYIEENKVLDDKKKKEIEKIVKSSDPGELTNRISKATGFRVVFPD